MKDVVPSVSAFSTSAWPDISNGLSLLFPRNCGVTINSDFTLPLLLLLSLQGASEITDNDVVSFLSWQAPKCVIVVVVVVIFAVVFSSLSVNTNNILFFCHGTTNMCTINVANKPNDKAVIKLPHHGI
jgi:hypothetical protein